MLAAGREMGLADDEARALALQTVAGAAALAAASSESVETLRKNVTSPGGTTHAAMTRLEAHGFKPALIEAILAARERARELGDEFGDRLRSRLLRAPRAAAALQGDSAQARGLESRAGPTGATAFRNPH